MALALPWKWVQEGHTQTQLWEFIHSERGHREDDKIIFSFGIS